jgi:ribosomal protein L11 methyltransferase
VLVELTLTADAAHAEPLADALLGAGALSVALEDADAASDDEDPLYGEPGLAPVRQSWKHSRLRVLVESDQAESLLANASQTIGIATPAVIACCALADIDWVRESQAQFPPTRIGDRLWIVPSWHSPPDDLTAIVVRLDPGVAFGTGTHPTTRLCLRWLELNLTAGASVLDYGCGSGILAIAAARLGAGTVVGTDIDPNALQAARANSEANAVRGHYTDPDSLAAARYDVVLANILSGPLKLLAPTLLTRVAHGGYLVLSGILQRQADEVIDVYRRLDESIALRVWGSDEGWACLAGQRLR